MKLQSMILCLSLTSIIACGGGVGSAYGTSGAANPMTSYLTDASGRTVYQYLGDVANSGVSNCTNTNGCYSVWPLVPAGEGLVATNSGVVSGTISSFTRADPSGSQATYRGLPLYYFTSDTVPGMVNGNGVSGFVIVSP